MNEQLAFNLFDYFPTHTKKTAVASTSQKKLLKNYAYDCGEELKGARKHLSQIPKFSTEWLEQVEENPSEAFQMVCKDSILIDFMPESLQEYGFTSEAAYGVKLILRKVSQRPEDSIEKRSDFITALLDLQNRLRECSDQEKFVATLMEIKEEVIKGDRSRYPLILRKEPDLKNFSYWLSLGNSFVSLFVSRSRRRTLPGYKNLIQQAFSEKGADWKWLQTKGKGASRTNKERWERKIPDEVIRMSQTPSGVNNPEDLIEHYGFRGIQFGRWMEDAAGKFHVLCSGNAWADLADILSIPRKCISIYGKLGLAFGSRGSGNASAHYEPLNNVMNLTKFRGGGSQCHEWAHALDFNLFSFSHKFTNGKLLSVSGNKPGEYLPYSVRTSFSELMKEIKNGTGSKKLILPDPFPKPTYRYRESIVSLLEKHEFNINEALLCVKDRYNCSTKQLSEIGFMYCQMISERTGSKPEYILIPTDLSSFYLDAAARGAYWKRDHELFARAFEAWIEDELAKRGMTNSYLVTGTTFGGPYPQSEERDSINDAFNHWWKSITLSGILHDEKLWKS
ncbi:hypothetical protein JI735_34695 (plasmid) [Paenibacillus sonchi]|uniref:Large polyvalent protein-associated domain-containing protein n=2 Tax=Paenibacillus sonchi TaxID=373687 RepID=A0A974PIF4_9BACL|nr:LPD1 domain-containing protein [Paenibacillus sonchi]QQZ64579.1 hypothetical protein JI735_34695 [Paenibacillus sonchi]